MKLLDGMIGKAVEASQRMKDMAEFVSELAGAVERLAKNLAVLAHHQNVHHQMIGRMWANQQAIIAKMGENAVSLALPKPDMSGKGSKKGADEPN